MQGDVKKETIWEESVSVWYTVRESYSICFGKTLEPDKGMQKWPRLPTSYNKEDSTLLSQGSWCVCVCVCVCDFDYQGDVQEG